MYVSALCFTMQTLEYEAGSLRIYVVPFDYNI